MDLEDKLLELGTFGRWQIFNFFSIGIFTMFPAVLHMLSIVFIGYKPAHHCTIENERNLQNRIPVVNGKLSSCNVFVNASNETSPCYDGWTYPGYEGSTIVTQWDLVCQQEHMASFSQAILVAGILTGAAFCSYLTDKIGRKRVFLWCQMGLGVVGCMTAFSFNLSMFLALRFFAGFLVQGLLLSGFVFLCEMFPARQRTFVGCMSQLFWAFICSLLPLLSYLIDDWRYLQLTISLFCFLSLPLFWYLRESLLWALANGKIDDAEETLRIAAKMNGLTLQEPILKPEIISVTIKIDHEGNIIKDETDEANLKRPLNDCVANGVMESKLNAISVKTLTENDSNQRQYSTFDLFKNKTILMYLIISSFIWLTNTLVYYGLVLSTAVLSGNRFVNAFLGGLMEFPAYISSYFALNRFGRKKSLMAYQCLAGVSLLVNAYIDREESGFRKSYYFLIILFNNIGKFGITGSFAIIALYSMEIFPTNLRTTAGGVCSFFGRAGNFLAIFFAYLSEKYSGIIMMFFGIISILVALMVVLLPETLNQTLPRTIEEACNLGKIKDKKEKEEKKTVGMNGNKTHIGKCVEKKNNVNEKMYDNDSGNTKLI